MDAPPEPFEIPPEQRVGAYAEVVALWHTAFDFVLDFAVLHARVGDPSATAETLVVSRVRIPTGLAFDLIRSLSGMMDRYEAQWGETRRPEPLEEGDGR